MRIAAWLSYNGAPFSGFARQNDQLTVQGSIEEALELLFRRPVETTCAGRTDSGVHALCQVVSFDLYDDEWSRRKPEALLRSLNALTDENISIREVRPMQEDFSARFSAVSREYRYFICTDAASPLLMDKFSWHLERPLDIARMASASQYLLGEHDFKSFCMAVSAKDKPTHRYVEEISFSQEEIWGSNFVVIRVVGNAFLHSMVRTMVGTLVLVGLGKREPEWVAEVLAAKNRQAAGQNAPAQGLVLWNVNYPAEAFRLSRPSQMLGDLAGEGPLSDAIEDISATPSPSATLPNISSSDENELSQFFTPDPVFGAYSASVEGKTAKRKGRGAQSAASARARRRAEKAKAREFVIPRGPDLSLSSTAEMPQVPPAAPASAPKDHATGDVRLEIIVPKIDEDAEGLAPNADLRHSDVDHQPNVGLHHPKVEKPETTNPDNDQVPRKKKDKTSSAVQRKTDSTPGVFSAANARARRRAQEAARSRKDV